jgi:hypothetical protein
MKTNKEVILSLEQCVEICGKWRHILTLDDWEVQIACLSVEELDPDMKEVAGEGHQIRGYTNLDFYTKLAYIVIITPTDEELLDGARDPWDMEKTIVHELMHIHYANASQKYGSDTYEDTKEIVLLEQAIDATTNALIAVKRGYYNELG